jgi:protein-S-isoprenylcysteine O-methyltransferase Ste14
VAPRLNDTGIYTWVRHPLYLANLLLCAGALCLVGNLALALTGLALIGGQYAVLAAAEDTFLHDRFGLRWMEWAGKTPGILPSRLLPPPLERANGLREVILREHNSLFATWGGFTLAVGWQLRSHLQAWALPFFLLLAAYLLVRVWRRRQRVRRRPEAAAVSAPPPRGNSRPEGADA